MCMCVRVRVLTFTYQIYAIVKISCNKIIKHTHTLTQYNLQWPFINFYDIYILLLFEIFDLYLTRYFYIEMHISLLWNGAAVVRGQHHTLYYCLPHIHVCSYVQRKQLKRKSISYKIRAFIIGNGVCVWTLCLYHGKATKYICHWPFKIEIYR